MFRLPSLHWKQNGVFILQILSQIGLIEAGIVVKIISNVYTSSFYVMIQSARSHWMWR